MQLFPTRLTLHHVPTFTFASHYSGTQLKLIIQFNTYCWKEPSLWNGILYKLRQIFIPLLFRVQSPAWVCCQMNKEFHFSLLLHCFSWKAVARWINHLAAGYFQLFEQLLCWSAGRIKLIFPSINLYRHNTVVQRFNYVMFQLDLWIIISSCLTIIPLTQR